MGMSDMIRFEKTSPEERVLECERQSALISSLREQLRRLRKEVDLKQQEVNESEKSIVVEQPEMYQKLCNINIEDREATKYLLLL